jgi:thioredoxin reductase (NADPH)
MTSLSQTNWDCLVVGGGPAGLTSALYLARFHRSVLVIDSGKSRACGISRTHNHPGFINGISGDTLVGTLRRQAEQYGAEVASGTVLALDRTSLGFAAHTTAGTFNASCTLIATGITDKGPDRESPGLPAENDSVRYCPVCDGFEATDKRIAVYGPPDEAAAKARFLRVYSPSVTLIPSRIVKGSPSADSEFELLSCPAQKFAAAGSGISVELADGEERYFDVLYPALGCHVHSDLAVALGAKANSVGCLIVDDKQRTTVEGLYAAGDVVSDLHQIVVAEGHAAVAATAIHNSLPYNFRQDP